jgi:hypothetical protein
VRELIGGDALLAALTEPVLRAHALLVRTVDRDELCRRFMAVPGVGPVVALTFKTTADDPARFKRSRDVGAYAGLTPKRIQSGDSIDYDGLVSRQDDGKLRTVLYEAASGLMTTIEELVQAEGMGNEAPAPPRTQEGAGGGVAQAVACTRCGATAASIGQAPEPQRESRSSEPATA